MKTFEDWLMDKSPQIRKMSPLDLAKKAWKESKEETLKWLLSERGMMMSDWNKEYLDTSIIHEELKNES